MLPMKAERLLLGTLLAADAGSFAPAVSANKIALVKANFALSENLIATDLTLADFTGSTAIAGATGTQPTGLDPSTGQQVLTNKTPLGGWRWVTGNTVNLPQTIYGFALFDTTLATLLAVGLLPTPIVLQIAGQEIDLGSVMINFVLNPMS